MNPPAQKQGCTPYWRAAHFLRRVRQERRNQQCRSAAVLGCEFPPRPGARIANWRRDAAKTRSQGRLRYVLLPRRAYTKIGMHVKFAWPNKKADKTNGFARLF